jgi:hypothetical protein
MDPRVELALLNSVTAKVHSLFDYSSTVWDPHLQKDIDRIENVQRRADRFIYSDYKRTSSVTAMMNELCWKPLNERRKE